MSKITDENYLHKLFIQEAAPALERHSGGSDVDMQEKTVDITENGTVEIVPDEGHALSKVVANVEVSSGGDGGSLADAIIDGSVTEVVSNAEKVAVNAFYQRNKLKKVILPLATSIDITAFVQSRNLVSVDCPAVTSIGQRAFYQCNGLKNANFPLVTSIDSSAFQECYSLSNFDFSTVKTIGKYAFYDCESLVDIKIPAVTTITEGAFANCGSLAKVDISTNVNLRGYTFSYCSVLSTVILRSESLCSLVATDVFSQSLIGSGAGYFYVPAALVDSYKSATNWSNYASQFRALEDYTVDGTITGELDETKI